LSKNTQYLEYFQQLFIGKWIFFEFVAAVKKNEIVGFPDAAGAGIVSSGFFFQCRLTPIHNN
jgi:hypothetical protein